MFECFVITLLKWINYKLTSVKIKKIFFWKMSKYRFLWFQIPISCYFFSVISSTIVLKYRFPNVFSPKSRNTVLKIFISRPPTNTTHPPDMVLGQCNILILRLTFFVTTPSDSQPQIVFTKNFILEAADVLDPPLPRLQYHSR